MIIKESATNSPVKLPGIIKTRSRVTSARDCCPIIEYATVKIFDRLELLSIPDILFNRVNTAITFSMIAVDLSGESKFGDEKMGKWKLKGCPRCNGDLSASEGEYGRYENCLQCGYVGYLDSIANVKVPNPIIFKEPVTAER